MIAGIFQPTEHLSLDFVLDRSVGFTRATSRGVWAISANHERVLQLIPHPPPTPSDREAAAQSHPQAVILDNENPHEHDKNHRKEPAPVDRPPRHSLPEQVHDENVNL